ncbi:MAG: hypothetical protein V4616_03950 [Bacteroidota bacterium]
MTGKLSFSAAVAKCGLAVALFLFSVTAFSQIRIIDVRDELVRGPAFNASHSSLRPILVDTLNYYPDIQLRKKHSKLYRALVFKHFIYYGDSTGVNFSVDPLMNFHFGISPSSAGPADTLYSMNTRGIKLEGNIGKQFTFVTMFYENQGTFVPYVDQYIRETGASIGMGRVKAFKDKSDSWLYRAVGMRSKPGFDFAMATGMIVYRPIKHAEIWFGHGKNFIGSGYRSLLLSDNSVNYPHLRLSYGFWGNRLRYQVIYAQLSTGRRYTSFSGTEGAFITKDATINYLTFSQSKRFEIGLFESTLWRRYQNNRQTPLDAMRFNPLIWVNSLSQGLSAQNNAMVGMTILYRPWRDVTMYGQLMLDGPRKNGAQVGISKANLLVPNLFVRGEVNIVSRGSYATTDSLDNYTQFRQPLAHPMGAGFTELTGTVGYRYDRWVFNVQSSVAVFPGGYDGYGRNLLYPDQQNIETQTVSNQPVSPSSYYFVNPTIGLIVNPSRNLQFTLGGIFRKVTTEQADVKSSYIFVGLSTNLNNLYFDF